ncbi:MAG: hypothetical protein K8L99_09040 [Anaerolineae bacterium]|nr:hypothetical protein [Anaerolineae bacterium]
MKLRALGWAAVSTVPQASLEKESLPVQEADIRELCAREGWHLVEILRVPGHSRSYLDFHEMSSDAVNAGITAFRDLERHWEAKDFDVLITRDGNRFAREQPPHAFMVLRTIRSGAFIQLINGGRVDAENVNMFVAMDGYRAAQDVSELRRKFQLGMNGRAKRGLVISSRAPISHRIVRDRSGKAIATEVNPVTAPMFEAAARLLLKGMAWDDMADELERLGFLRPDGKRYPRATIYKNFTNPLFWGNMARWYGKSRVGPWIFDPEVPPPDGVRMWYDRIPPALPEELIEPMQAELRKRFSSGGRGNWYTNRYRFSGLGICDECGSTISVRSNRTRKGELYREGLGCATFWGRSTQKVCSQTKYVSHAVLQDFFEHLLEQIFEDDDFFKIDQPTQDTLAPLQLQLENVSRQIDRMITEQSLAPESVQPRYRQQIEVLSQQYDILRAQIQSQEYARKDYERQHRHQQHALEEIRELTLETFWNLPDPEINRLLRLLMGDLRIVIRGKEIVDLRTV